ncbi:hypothetical protein [Bacteroides cellulosilyticus]|uniref:hypothetical protein n=1 Tax=Bacteroides cellulosilyticus TaxID=246787 RepID=UPI0020CB158C|nr:hypothetical protein [Bacteroides cellulosilyticus]
MKILNTPYPAIGILMLTAATLTACIKDDLYNTPSPSQGSIILTTDWTQRGEGIPVPTGYTVEAAGSTFILQAQETAIPALFAPGDITLLGYNLPEGVSIANGTATVARTTADGSLQRPDPGMLFGGTAVTTVIADDTVRVSLPMRQLFRRVQFELTITGGDPERITGIEARLEGAAPSVNISTGEVASETIHTTADAAAGNAVSVQIPFVRTGNKLTAAIQMPGIIATAPQRTLITLAFTDGKRQTAETDVSEAFANFNANRLTPLRLSGSLYAPEGAEAGGSILKWTDVQGGDVDAEM